MTTPSNPRSFSSGSSSYNPASSEYSPTSTSTPFATPATRATSIAPSTFSRSGPGNRRAKMSGLVSLTGISSHNEDIQASPTPSGSRSGTPATMDASSASNKAHDSHSVPGRPGPRGKAASNTTNQASVTLPAGSQSATSSSSTANTNASELSKDAEDFFARAQAMGLRLTREDYERTKAGVAAFLKAERRPLPSNASASFSSTSTSASNKPTEGASSSSSLTKSNTTAGASSEASTTVDAKSSTSQNRLSGPSPLARASSSGWTRNTSNPGLSFFTAVIEPDVSPGSTKSHPSLDEIGNAEERRRLKIKKMKLRERREREKAILAATSSASGLLDTPNSNAVQSSPETNNSAFTTPPTRVKPTKSSSGGSKRSARVGLGLDLAESDSNTSPDPVTPPEPLQSSLSRHRSRGRTVSFENTSPVVRVSEEVQQCTTLEELTRRAWVSPKGTLRLLKSPIEEDAVFPGNSAEADDSGSMFDHEDLSAAPTRGLAADGWGTNHRRGSSACSNAAVAEALDTKMSRLNMLDHVMAQQSSPRRLYKEAKQRQKQLLLRKQAEEKEQAELAAKQISAIAARAEAEKVESEKAAAAAEAIKAANPDYASLIVKTPESGSKVRKTPESVVRGTPLPAEASSSKALRWSMIGASPSNLHARMSTREHYDFTMHGISPGQPSMDAFESLCNIHATPGPITFHSWDAEPLSSVKKMAEGRSSAAKTSIAGTPAAAHFLLGGDEGRPELIGVSPSVANFFHARQVSAHGSAQHKLTRSNSDGVAVMSPLSGRLVSGVASRISDLDFDADDDVQLHDEGLDSLGKAPTFNARRGLLFSAPGGTATNLEQPSVTTSLLASPSKLVGVAAASPARFRKTLLGAGGDEMIGGKLPFASPRSALVRAHSVNVLDARRERQPSETMRDLLGGPSGSRHDRTHSRKGLLDSFDTISPADVFGSSLPRALSAVDDSPALPVPLPEPTKSVRDTDAATSAATEELKADSSKKAEKKKRKAARRARSLSPESPSKQKVVQSSAEPLLQTPANVDASVLEAPLPALVRAGSAEPVLSSPPRATNLTQTPIVPSVGLPAGATLPSQPLFAQQTSTKKAKKSKAGGSTPSSTPAAFKVIDLPCQNFEHMTKAAPSVQNGDEIGWDQPDGSRLVKLISEELRAALEAGTLTEEPAARYYLLPPGYGQSKAKPSSVSYAGLIGQAIKSSSDMRLSLSEIYEWISCTYPFFEKGDRGWQNSIRHNLSLNKSFIKIERETNMPGKGGWWGIKDGHEDRFQNGLYNAAPQKLDATKNKSATDAQRMNSSPAAAELTLSTPASSQTDQGLGVSRTSTSQVADKPAKKRGKAKRKKGGDNGADSGEESENDASPSDKASARQLKRTKITGQVTVADRLPLMELQSQNQSQHPMVAMGGLDSITPIRPPLDSSSVYGSSAAGSHYSKTVPTLIDTASSPPSSPLTLMPPPSMQMTADHSARKRKMAGQSNGQLGYGTGFSPSLYGAYRNMRGSALGGAFVFSNQTESDASRGSPLRGQSKMLGGEENKKSDSVNAGGNSMVTSPKRLWSISSPTSSMRGSMPSFGGPKKGSDEWMRSPTSSARVAAALAHSPLRSSPLRSGAAGLMSGGVGSPNSNASLQIQLAMNGSMGFGNMGFGAGLGMGSGLTPGRTPGSLRYSTGFSPVRRGLAANPSGQAAQMMAMNMSGVGQQPQLQAWYLDDPFELQANLQQQPQSQQQHLLHQHQHYQSQQQAQQQQHQHQRQQLQSHSQQAMDMSRGQQFHSFGPPTDGVTTSPLRMAWNSIQAAGGVQAFTAGGGQHSQARQQH